MRFLGFNDKSTHADCVVADKAAAISEEDILSMYVRLNKTATGTSIPTSVATKLKHLPSFVLSEVDVCALAANVNKPQSQIEVMSATIKNLAKGQADMVAAVESACSNRITMATVAAEVRSTMPSVKSKRLSIQQPGDAATKSWAERASPALAVTSQDGDSPDGFTTVSYKRRRPKESVKLTGKRATNENVKTVQRRRVTTGSVCLVWSGLFRGL